MEAEAKPTDSPSQSPKPTEKPNAEKAKLPSDALWRTKVEFRDCPVKIAKWSEAKDRLRIGMRVVEDEWRVGGKRPSISKQWRVDEWPKQRVV